MKNILLIILLLVFGTAAHAQDKIITIKQDTIECRIISVNAERITYEQKTSYQLMVGKSIPVSEVLQYFRSEKPVSMGDDVQKKIIRKRPEHRWLFSMQGGLAHSLTDYDDYKTFMLSSGNPASMADDYIRKLKNGVQFNASFHYLLASFIGLGVDYNLFHSSATGEFLAPGYGDINVPLYTKLGLDERLYTHFAGVSFLFQQFPDIKKRIRISQTLSPGMVLFRGESRSIQLQPYGGNSAGSDYPNGSPSYYIQANSLTTGTTFGAKGSLSVQYGFTPQLSAGLAGNFMWAKLQKISTKNAVIESEDQELGDPTNISHIDYGLIIRYHF